MKYFNPIIGLIIFILGLKGLPSGNMSIWDYEGFSLIKISLFLIGILFFLDGIYTLLKYNIIEFKEEAMIINSSNNLEVPYTSVNQVDCSKFHLTLKTTEGNFYIPNIVVHNRLELEELLFEKLKLKKVQKNSWMPVGYLGLIFLLLMIPVFLKEHSPNHQKIKSFLPLKKIETTQIEGTVVRRADFTSGRNESGLVGSLSFGGMGLEEFPNIYFRYYNGSFSPLKDKIINIKNSDAQKVEELNKKYKGKSEKFHRFPKGTKVKIKIRIKDYEDLKEFMKSEDYLTNNRENFNLRNSIKIYEFAVNDEVILQKIGLN